MKLLLFVSLTLVTIKLATSENNGTTTITRLSPSKEKFVDILRNKLQYLWKKFAVERSDTFVGRCFGMARKLKFAMPLIIFKLGVIVTILGFLTIFSLKTLGLLGFLILLNVSGAMSKLALLLSGKHAASKSWSPPQNVHLHVHQTKDGTYDVGHTAAGWDDRLDSQEMNNLENNNFYNKLLLNNLLLRNRGYVESL